MKETIYHAAILMLAIFTAGLISRPTLAQVPSLKANLVKTQKKPDNWIKMKQGIVISPQKYGEFKIQGSSNKPRNLNPECGDHPTCEPTAADNCCSFMEKCNKDVYCATIDWGEYQEIDPDIEPANYCKKCLQAYTGDDADIPLDVSMCWCSKTPSPSGPFDYANHDTLTLWLGAKSGPSPSTPENQFKMAGEVADFVIEYTDKSGNKKIKSGNGSWVSIYKTEERFWVGCNKNELHFAPKPGESLEKFHYEGGGENFYEVAPNTRIIIRSPNISCEFKDHNYSVPNHLVTAIPGTGFEFSRESNSIRIDVKKKPVAGDFRAKSKSPPTVPTWVSQ